MLAGRSQSWIRSLLALIVITANVGAPFRTSAFGRAFLGDLSRSAASHSPVVRVRAISHLGAALGHRAPVGLGKGGADRPHLRAGEGVLSSFLPRSTAASPRQRHERPIPRPNPPLRC